MESANDYCAPPHAWREAGRGRCVVFLHGLGGSRTAWDPQLDELSSSFRCVAWDMPGYGAAEACRPLTYAAIARRLVELLDHLEVERADLVGESFGGMHALHTALHFPDRVNRMVLTNTSPAFGMDGTDPDEWRRSRTAALDEGATPAGMAASILTAIAGPRLVGHKLQQRIDAFARISSEGLRASVEMLPTNDIRSELGQLHHKTLVVAGELDHETPVPYAEVLHEGLPNSELVVLEGIGHLAASEDPDRFNELVRRHLTR